MDSEVSSVDEDFSSASDPLESSECSSADDSEVQADSAKSLKLHESLACSKQSYLSALCFSNISKEQSFVQSPQIDKKLSMQNDLNIHCNEEPAFRKYGDACRQAVELSRSWISEFQYAGNAPDLGWPIGGLLGNPLSTNQRFKDDRGSVAADGFHDTSTSGQTLDEVSSCSVDQSLSGGILMNELSDRHAYSSSNSFLIQS